MSRMHVTGFFEDQDGAGTLQNLAAHVDTIEGALVPVDGADFLRVDSSMPLIIGVHAGIDATVQPRARLVQPSFKRTYGKTAVELPVLSSTVEPASPHAFNDFRSHPVRCQGGEKLSVETLNNPAAAANQYVMCVFADQVPQPVALPASAVPYRFTTAASALTADAWNSRAITPEEDLPDGWYDVYGGKAISTSAIMARLKIPGQDNRPPIGACDTRTDVIHPFFAPGQLGVLGRIHSKNLPALEILADAADNEVQVLDLWMAPVSSGGRR